MLSVEKQGGMNVIHGGDIYRNKVTMDFSVNVNPLGMPESVKRALREAVSLCTGYPDPEEEQLREAVSSMISVGKESLVFGNGTSELFIATIHALKPERIVIPTPSFFGYEHAAAAGEGAAVYYPMKKENNYLPDEDIFSYLTEKTDLLFLAAPNNPVGNLLPAALLERILRHCEEKKIWVVLDECFIELCGRHSAALTQIGKHKHLVIIRAFTKVFAIPGVRLGYLISGSESLPAEIRKQLPEWNLSIFAQKAGVACAGESGFISKTAEYIRKEREFLANGLKKAGFTVFPGSANFIMIHTEIPLYEKLLEKGILIRDCGNFRGLSKGYYRFAVKRREENERLLSVIEELT